VRDCGIGIPVAQRFRIFQHLTLADSTHHPEARRYRTGLGHLQQVPLHRRAPLPLPTAEDNFVNRLVARGRQPVDRVTLAPVLVAWAEGAPAEAAAPLLLRFLVETNLPPSRLRD